MSTHISRSLLKVWIEMWEKSMIAKPVRPAFCGVPSITTGPCVTLIPQSKAICFIACLTFCLLAVASGLQFHPSMIMWNLLWLLFTFDATKYYFTRKGGLYSNDRILV